MNINAFVVAIRRSEIYYIVNTFYMFIIDIYLT